MKPYVICYMMQSVDGRIACDMVDKISGDEYYDALGSLDCQAHIEGRHSYQIHRCGFGEFKPTVQGHIAEPAVYVAGRADVYSVSVDTRGTLLWDDGNNSGHICIVSLKASPGYLDYLRAKGISYIAVGEDRIDLARAASILHDKFDVKRIAVVGGGEINGGFLAAGLLDEISVMTAPGIDGRKGQPALSTASPTNPDSRPRDWNSRKYRLIPTASCGRGIKSLSKASARRDAIGSRPRRL